MRSRLPDSTAAGRALAIARKCMVDDAGSSGSESDAADLVAPDTASMQAQLEAVASLQEAASERVDPEADSAILRLQVRDQSSTAHL